MSLSYLHQFAHLAVNPDKGVVCEGWLLKKRRKKMQGFARRYFVLHQSGILTYAISPKHPIRDQIAIPQAALSTAIGRRDIHIDSSNTTFHIKCLTTEDFNTWMSAFRKFIIADGRKSTVIARASARPSHSQWNRSSVIAEDMSSIIAELESAIAVLQTNDSRKKNSSLKSKSDKEKHGHLKDSKFSMFKKSGGHHEDGTLAKSIADPNHLAHFQRINTALESLKAQHAALLRSLHGIQGDMTPPGASPPSTAVEQKPEELLSTSRFSTALTRQSKRSPSTSSLSDSGPIEWFDAQDNVAEEFVLEDPTPDEERGPLSLPSGGMSYKEYESASSDDDEEMPPQPPDPAVDSTLRAHQIIRRTRLPCGPVGDEGSLFAILKKNVGKDLSTITFPVSFNEPLTILHRAAEEMEYHDLLQQAADSTDSVERICFVAAFAVSGYAHTRHRTGRKGFNPVLAETFEDIRMKFIAEKVSHNPVIIAYHAEGNGWELEATSAGKTKFWGKSLEIIPLGTTRLSIGQDRYEWQVNKPSSFMRNLMMGTKYLEHCGKMTIKNLSSGMSCVIDFRQAGYWGASNEVAGTVLSASGEVCAHIEGKWDEQIALALDPSHLRVLWRITPFPKQALDYYGFTGFAITLNEITVDLEGKLPPTDSRFRPDVRALEEGNVDLAEEQKTRLEELQRDRRRRGVDRLPRWFKQVGEDWVYVGGYWEERTRGWRDIEPLW
ncbi:hypothetical protein ID866_1529 [Astraeus odoratus]|nr:hypothetical protein ID866_1529 [Astraeus odoratus]